MKKSLLTLGILLVAVITLTGCGSTKTLTCTIEDGGNSDSYIFKFEKDTLKEAKVSSVYVADTTEEAEEMKSQIDESATLFSGVDGIEYKAEIKDKTVSGTIVLNFDKIDEQYRSGLVALIGGVEEYDALKQLYEGNNYNCK